MYSINKALGFLNDYKISSAKLTTLTVQKTTDYNNYLDFDLIGFVDNKHYKYNKAFLFKSCNNEEFYEIKAKIKLGLSIIRYDTFTEELIVEITNKNYLKNITIKIRKEQ